MHDCQALYEYGPREAISQSITPLPPSSSQSWVKRTNGGLAASASSPSRGQDVMMMVVVVREEEEEASLPILLPSNVLVVTP